MAECFLGGVGATPKIAYGYNVIHDRAAIIDISSYGFTETPVVLASVTNEVEGGYVMVDKRTLSATSITLLVSDSQLSVYWLAIGK